MRALGQFTVYDRQECLQVGPFLHQEMRERGAEEPLLPHKLVKRLVVQHLLFTSVLVLCSSPTKTTPLALGARGLSRCHPNSPTSADDLVPSTALSSSGDALGL